MNLLTSCVGLPFILQISAYQNEYVVYQENITVSHLDNKIIDLSAELYPLNEFVNALNMTVRSKQEIAENGKMYLTAYRWLKSGNQARLVHIAKSLAEATQMDSFGVEALCTQYMRPPLVWPVKKGVTYRSVGWTPDSTKCPPKLPGGRYKVHMSFENTNRTVFCVIDWFVRIIYKK